MGIGIAQSMVTMTKILINPLYRWNILWTALFALSLALGIINHNLELRTGVGSAGLASRYGHEATMRVQQIIRQESQQISVPEQRRIAEQVLHVAKKNQMDPLMVLSIIKVESTFRPEVVSYAGAVGLMQIKPIVLRELELDVRPYGSAMGLLQDPTANIEAGVSYLSFLRERFGADNWYHVLAAYNMGPTAVGRQVKRGQNPSRRYYLKVMNAYRDYLSLQLPEAV